MANCSTKVTKIVGRYGYLLALVLTVADAVTDVLQILDYWEEQSQTLAIMASASLGLSGLLLVFGYLPILAYQIYYRTIKDKDKTDEKYKKYSKIGLWLKCVDTLIHDLPQMCISIYVLSLCQEEVRILQYITLGLSFISANYGVTQMDGLVVQACTECKKKAQDRQANSESMGCLCSVQFLEKLQKTMPIKLHHYDYAFIFLIKGCGMAARAISIVIAVQLVGWRVLWVPVVIPISVVGCVVVVWCCRRGKDTKQCLKISIQIILIGIYSLIFIFVWVSHSRAFTFFFAAMYAGLNMVAPATALNETTTGTCFVSHADAMSNAQIGLSGASCLIALIYMQVVFICYCRKGEGNCNQPQPDSATKAAGVVNEAADISNSVLQTVNA